MSARLILAALIAASAPSALVAQAVVQPLGLTDADLLATQMRQLAANPRDLVALATAGELSLRVGDLSGAAALFARADKIDPRNGRVKAGMASILVRSERPGEALRFFGQAEAYGWPAVRFASDRGLAFDLIGEQERAQRDYRLALRGGADDETARRYALSLGISGRQAQALEQLDPLVRRQDRAAWRAQAFVLAMGGDTAGAAKIATAMMPATMAQGLGAFFVRLPALGPVDRAFAVHFGEVFATPERLADARLTPALAPLLPEIGAPRVQVAQAAPPVRDRRSRRERERDERRAQERAIALARAQARARPVVLAATRPVTLPATQTATTTFRPAPTRPAPTPPVPTRPVPTSLAATPATMRETDVRMAAATPVLAPSVARPTTIAATPLAAAVPTTASPGGTSVAVRPTMSQPAAIPSPSVAPPPALAAVPPATVVAAVAAPTLAASGPYGPVDSPAPSALARPAAAPPVLTTQTPAVVAASAPSPGGAIAPMPSATIASAPAPAVAFASAPVATAPIETAAVTERADSVLARIVASLSIPASELGIAPPPRADPAPVPPPVPLPAAVARAPASPAGRRIVAEATAKEARDAGVRRTVAARLTGDANADDPRARDRNEPPLTPRARRAAAAKALADKKVADEKKALAARESEEKRIARTRPARIWVQVAGGANERDLPRAWRAVQAKAPGLAGKAGYSTPLRATNRVLTGPFKTEAEARALVNQLAKQGVSGFSFTSEAGQDVKKLGGK